MELKVCALPFIRGVWRGALHWAAKIRPGGWSCGTLLCMSTQMRESMGVALTRETTREIHAAMGPAPTRPKRLYADDVDALPEPVRSIVLERLERAVGQCVYLMPSDHGISVVVRNGPLPRE